MAGGGIGDVLTGGSDIGEVVRAGRDTDELWPVPWTAVACAYSAPGAVWSPATTTFDGSMGWPDPTDEGEHSVCGPRGQAPSSRGSRARPGRGRGVVADVVHA